MLLYKTPIDENSNSSGVDQHINKEQFKSISSLKRDGEV